LGGKTGCSSAVLFSTAVSHDILDFQREHSFKGRFGRNSAFRSHLNSDIRAIRFRLSFLTTRGKVKMTFTVSISHIEKQPFVRIPSHHKERPNGKYEKQPKIWH